MDKQRRRGAMLYKECGSCQDIRKILDENKVLLDQSIIDSIREHFIELHGDQCRHISEAASDNFLK